MKMYEMLMLSRKKTFFLQYILVKPSLLFPPALVKTLLLLYWQGILELYISNIGVMDRYVVPLDWLQAQIYSFDKYTQCTLQRV